MNAIRLTLPYPPTANNYKARSRDGHWYRTKNAEAFRRAVRLRALAAGVQPLDGELYMRLFVFRPRRLGDLDNSLKVLLDALEGVAFANDAQIAELRACRFEDRANPRVEVHIEPHLPRGTH